MTEELSGKSSELKAEELTVTAKDAVLEPSLKKDMENRLEQMLVEKKEKEMVHQPEIPSAWNLSAKGKDAVRKALSVYNTEFGLYASIPMICKGEDCVYAQLFPELHGELTEPGERCPVEVALIMSKYAAYTNELEVSPDDAVDMSILRDVIDYDIQIVRAENKMALEGDFVKDVTVGVNEAGVPVTQEQISQAAQYKDKIQTKRNAALKLLNSTRKDKAGEKINMTMDPSTYARELLNRKDDVTIEGDFDELEVIPDIEYGS